MTSDTVPVTPAPPVVPAPTAEGTDPNVAAFLRDLPELLQTIPDVWVAYAYGQRVRTGPRKTPLYRYCRNELGLPHEAFIVRMVLPQGSDEIEILPRPD